MRHYPLYRFLNRMIDRMTMCKLKHELDKVLDMDTWTRERIRANQIEKFARLSEIAGHSEFYRPFAGKPLEEYPVLYREDFKVHAGELKTHLRKPYFVNHTSGSTGNPIEICISREMLMAKRVAHQKMLRWFGVPREAPEFKIGGVKVGWKFRIYYYFRNKRFINSFRFSQKKVERIIRKYNRFKPEVLYGYPSAIFNFVQAAESCCIPVHQPRIVVTHAENLYHEFREKFEAVFPGAKIVNQYWASEANIGVCCPEGNLHVDEDTVICEVINKDENGVGDLLITNLYSFDQPLIRYKIGDRVKVSDRKCPCGRETKIIEYIEGRENESIELPDGRELPVTIMYISRIAENIKSYQLIYHRTNWTMELRYIPVDPEMPIREKSILEYFQSTFGLNVVFREVKSIEYTPGGKFKKLIKMD